MSSSRAKAACLFVLALALAVTAGCGGGGSKKTPPAGPLIQQAATAMRSVTSLSFTLRTAGDTEIKVKSVDAKLLQNGNAQGAVQVTQLSMSLQLDFVVLGKTVYLKGLTGGWQKEPLASVAGIYDPSAILDPNRGLVHLLLTAKDPSNRGTEKVAGEDCHKVHATLAQQAVATLIPGLSSDTPADLWISASSHRVLKAEVQAAATNGGKPGTATVTFADFNTPFTISAPAQ